MKVYVAGPYTVSDPVINTRKAIFVGNEIMVMGHTPFVPHLTMLWHLQHPHTWREWMDWCLPWVAVCDAVYRIPGTSKGADEEVAFAKSLGIPIYTNLDQLRDDSL